jgi:acetyl-CoA/propionyl-CoA carboxylase, biotin carboxylase, biotin carboxyl carrier protein
MLAKVIAHGPDRAAALRRLNRALATFELVGVTTNAAFTRGLIQRDDVRAGEQDTGLLERVLADAPAPAPDDFLPAAALAAAGTAHPPGPWRRRIDGHGEVRVSDGTVTCGDRSWTDVAIRVDREGAARVTLDGVERRYAVHVADEAIWIFRAGHQLELRTARVRRDGEGGLVDSLQAPMPGTVLLVHVADGDVVDEGDVLMVLESMKMELSITAPHDGVVDGVTLKPGDRVALKQPLLAVHANGSEGQG